MELTSQVKKPNWERTLRYLHSLELQASASALEALKTRIEFLAHRSYEPQKVEKLGQVFNHHVMRAERFAEHRHYLSAEFQVDYRLGSKP